jgi:hypothetical protein
MYTVSLFVFISNVLYTTITVKHNMSSNLSRLRWYQYKNCIFACILHQKRSFWAGSIIKIGRIYSVRGSVKKRGGGVWRAFYAATASQVLCTVYVSAESTTPQACLQSFRFVCFPSCPPPLTLTLPHPSLLTPPPSPPSLTENITPFFLAISSHHCPLYHFVKKKTFRLPSFFQRYLLYPLLIVFLVFNLAFNNLKNCLLCYLSFNCTF